MTTTLLRRWGAPLAAMGLVAALVAGCASSTPPKATPLPTAPEPAVSPPATGAIPGLVLTQDGGPEGVAITDTGLVGVNLRHPDGLLLFPITDPSDTRTVPLPGSARHLVLDAPGGPFLVPEESVDHLVEVDSAGQVVVSVPTGRQPHDAIPVGDGRVFVADELANTIHIVSGSHVVRVVPSPLQPGGMATTDGGQRIAVVGVRGRRIAEYTPAGTLLGAANCGAGPTHAVTGDDQVVWVADTLGGALLGFRLGPHGPRQVARIPVGPRPYGLAYDPVRKVVWVTITGSDRLVGVTVSGSHVVSERSYATVRQPNTVAVDPATGELVITGSTSVGALQLLDP